MKIEVSNENETTVVKAVVDDNKFEEFIAKQFSQANNEPDKVVIEITGQGDRVQTEMNASTLTKLADKAPTALLEIRSELAALAVPANDLKNAIEKLGLSLDNVNLSIAMTKADPQVTGFLAQTGAIPLVAPVDFKIVVTPKNGAGTEINRLSGPIEHSLDLPETAKDVPTRELAGVLIDPATGKYYPIPTLFSTEGGKVKATLIRQGNSIYTVVRNKKTFSDVPADHYANANIETLAAKFVVAGYENGTFGPDRPVTRAEFASLLTRALGILPEVNTSGKFTDVKAGDWYAGSVAAAVKAGLVHGYGDGTFGPDRQISRQEMAAMIYNALKASGYAKTLTEEEKARALAKFNDQDGIQAWARDAAAAVVSEGIVGGVGGGLFSPDTNADRAQSAAILYRMMKTLRFMN